MFKYIKSLKIRYNSRKATKTYYKVKNDIENTFNKLSSDKTLTEKIYWEKVSVIYNYFEEVIEYNYLKGYFNYTTKENLRCRLQTLVLDTPLKLFKEN